MRAKTNRHEAAGTSRGLMSLGRAEVFDVGRNAR